MKKGQAQTQIFVYIIALIVIALVLLYGYNAIKGFIGKSEQVNLAQFTTDFNNAIKSQSYEKSSVTKKQIMLPSGYNAFVLVDTSKPVNDTQEFADAFPLIYDSWSGGVKQNMFLVGKSKFEAYDAGNLYFEPERDVLIIHAPDRVVDLKLTGMAGSTKVEEWDI